MSALTLDALLTWNQFRLEFMQDKATKDMKWILYANGKRGCIGKLVFRIDRRHKTVFVKYIFVDKEWRGRGLSRVLYLACLSSVQTHAIEEIQLEAEEDALRYGKLVEMYVSWGFHVEKDASITFLPNDSSVFRKIPMSAALSSIEKLFHPDPMQPTSSWFSMLVLQSSDGKYIVATEHGKVELRSHKSQTSMWQIVMDQNGVLFLRSAFGKYLCVEENGNIVADRKHNSTWETFQAVSYLPDIKRHAAEHYWTVAKNELITKTLAFAHYENGDRVALKDFHGGVLCIDEKSRKLGSFKVWKKCALENSIENCIAQQSKAVMRGHYERHRARDTSKMSLLDACQALIKLQSDSELEMSWIIQYMIASGVMAQREGHPDWIQLCMFLRGLGLLFRMKTEDRELTGISAADWMMHAKMMVFETEWSHTNEEMEDITLPWTPNEYLYHVLRDNQTYLPSEALHIIRFFSYDMRSYVAKNSECIELQDILVPLEACQSMNIYCEEFVNAEELHALLDNFVDIGSRYLPKEICW